jgi:hypothetical protein
MKGPPADLIVRCVSGLVALAMFWVSDMMPGMTRLMVIIGGGLFGAGFSGILYPTQAFQNAGPPLLISCSAAGLGLGLVVAGFVSRD